MSTPKPVSSDFLIKASDRLAEQPDFKLVGRQKEIDAITNALIRQDGRNNVALIGKSGSGLTSILLGLEAIKQSPDTPYEVAAKRYYYLDMDALFSNPAGIVEGMDNAIHTLSKVPDSVLVLENPKDFISGLEKAGLTQVVNKLVRAVTVNKSFQIVVESSKDSLGSLLVAHEDIMKVLTPVTVSELTSEELHDILVDAAGKIAAKHGIAIAPDVVDALVSVATKYPSISLDMAQPKRSISIMEGAMIAYSRKVHTKAGALEALNEKLASITAAIESGKPEGIYADKSPAELEALKIEAENAVQEASVSWEDRQEKMRQAYKNLTEGEEALARIDQNIEDTKKKEKYIADAQEAYAKAEAAGDAEGQKAIREEFQVKMGKPFSPGVSEAQKKELYGEGTDVNKKLKDLFGGAAVVKDEDDRAKIKAGIEKDKAAYEAMAKEFNEGLELTADYVLTEFSGLSGIPMNKLTQDETEKLLNLEENIKKRVFGQEEPIKAVVQSLKRARTGLKKPKKPIGSFIFLGPSGVGKTELARALAEAWFGSEEVGMQTYNMPEYGQEYSLSTLIGSPPGYQGSETGGVLTNNMIDQPHVVNVFDEMEKANKKIYDIFLQIVDEGKVTDARGIASFFSDSINIFTSNVGAQHFLNPDISFEEATKLAMADLYNPEVGGFRPEFLNRFTGIFCFNRLEQPEIQKIALKKLKATNALLADRNIEVRMTESDLIAMCKDQYSKEKDTIKMGGRSIERYIEINVETQISDMLLRTPDVPGIVNVKYTPAKKDGEKLVDGTVALEFIPQAPAAKEPATAPKPAVKATP